jgi:hypothetical protein
MTVMLACVAVIGLSLVLWKSAPGGLSALPSRSSSSSSNDLKQHGNEPKEHGKHVEEKAKGKTCPHCGKPL